MSLAFMDDTDAAGNIYAIERLAHLQVGALVSERPAVIVPLGGCEPVGAAGALGAESACALAVSAELSGRCRVLRAPALPFGCSTPFISFAGAAGVKPRTFVNMLCEILHAYVFQGADRIFLVSAAPFNREPAREALRRVEVKYPGVRAALFDINTILVDNNMSINNNAGSGNVNNGVSDNRIDNNKPGGNPRKKGVKDGGAGFDRDDALLLSLLAYLRPNPSMRPNLSVRPNLSGQYQTWKRRGRDPQKLRKLVPDALLLASGVDDITPERGKDYFYRIVGIIQARIENMLVTERARGPSGPD